MPPTTTRKTHRCHQCNHTARALVFKNKRGRGWIRRKRGEKKEWRIFAWIKDRLSSAPNKSGINNTVADCITLHRCRTPKGPRAERLFGGSSAKMGYIWQLNKRGEEERESGIERGSGRRREKKRKHCQMNDIRLPFIPSLLPPSHCNWLKCVSSCLH